MLGVVGAVVVLAVSSCGWIGFSIYRGMNQLTTEVTTTVQQVKQDFAADLAAHRARVDENRRRDFVALTKGRAEAHKQHYEFFRDLQSEATTPFHRAARDNPESFANEFQVKDEYLPKLEATKTLEECQRLAAKLEAKVLAIRKERYLPELEALRASVAREFATVDANAYCVVKVEPPMSAFGKTAYGAALAFDLTTGMWMASAANLGETPALPFSQSILDNAGKLRVAVIRERERAIDYIVESVFAENHFDGASPEACPWQLVTALPHETTAQAAAEQAVAELRAARQPAPKSGKAPDPRPVIMVRVPDVK